MLRDQTSARQKARLLDTSTWSHLPPKLSSPVNMLPQLRDRNSELALLRLHPINKYNCMAKTLAPSKHQSPVNKQRHSFWPSGYNRITSKSKRGGEAGSRAKATVVVSKIGSGIARISLVVRPVPPAFRARHCFRGATARNLSRAEAMAVRLRKGKRSSRTEGH